MDPIALAKSHAGKLRARPFLDLELTQGHALELVTALVSSARSWNEFTAQPSAAQLPTTMSDYFGATARSQRRLQSLGLRPHWVRGLRSTASMHFLDAIFSVEDHGQSLWELMDTVGAPPILIADGPNIRGSTLAESPEFLVPRVSRWFFRELGPDTKYGEYPWDFTAALAKSRGFSDQEAAMVRQLQREAPNHSWDLDLWFEVGVLDPDQSAFLDELQNQTNWYESFEKLYATDGGRGSYDELPD